MIWVCGWCRPGERAIREIEPFDQQDLTHGICSRHLEQEQQRLEELRAQRAQKEATA